MNISRNVSAYSCLTKQRDIFNIDGADANQIASFMMKVGKKMFGDDGRCARSLRGCVASAASPRAHQLACYPLHPAFTPVYLN